MCVIIKLFEYKNHSFRVKYKVYLILFIAIIKTRPYLAYMQLVVCHLITFFSSANLRVP